MGYLTRTIGIRAVYVLLSIFLPLSLPAQVGVGGGVASIGESVQKAGGEFESLFEKGGEELTYEDISGEVGLYGMVGGKMSLGGVRLAGELSYAYFQASQITLTSLTVNDDTTVSATFEVGTSLIPISLGLEYALPIETFHPYVGAYPVYTIVNRTYTHIEGDQVSGIENASAGENEFGVGAEVGAEFGLGGTVGLGVRLRFTVMNLFSAREGENSSGLLQLGASLWFGDLFPGEEGEEGEDESE